MDVLASSLVSDTRLLVPSSSQSSAQVRASSTASSCVFSSRNAKPVAAGRSISRRRSSSSSNLAFVKSFRPVALQQQLGQRRFRANLRSAATAAAADGTVALEEAAGETTEAAEEVVPIEKRYPAFPAVLDINAIRQILPHRFPFLLVDRVIEYNPGVSAVAIKNVTINDNFFPGHFPERPIMPGVLMVEALAQVGGIVMLNPDVGGSKASFFFAGVDKVRFRKPVIAGDTLVMRMNLVKLQKRFGIAKMEGKAYVGGELVCEGEFLMALGSDE